MKYMIQRATGGSNLRIVVEGDSINEVVEALKSLLQMNIRLAYLEEDESVVIVSNSHELVVLKKL